MKKLTALAIFAIASFAFAQDGAIHNVCDTLSLGAQPEIELVPAYIDESNWYGNPRTWVKDSSTFKRHESYETLTMSYSKNKSMQIPVSITAACREMQGTRLGVAKWTTNQTWKSEVVSGYTTDIYDIRALKMNGHDSTNTYNILAFVNGPFPEEGHPFQANELLFSETFEFAFEWWFASAKYQHFTDATHATNQYGSSVGNDSLKVVNAAISALAIPDSITNIRIQVVKMVFMDSRKQFIPGSSSSSVVCSSSVVPASSSVTESSSSIVESSSSKPASSSSQPSSSSKTPESSSSKIPESSSSVVPSSSSKPVSSSSSIPASSSSVDKSSSSVAPESSSTGPEPKSSSSKKQESSSSEKSDRIMVLGGQDASRYVVQVRRLDGTIAKDSRKLGPGVYYVKYSDGTWQKKALLLK